MKNIILVLLTFLFSIGMVAQEKKNKNKSAALKVTGNCEMCEKRIEKAAFSVKGVKSAEWHADHGDIHLIFDENKCTIIEIAQAIANAGHDTELIKAKDKIYEKLHDCCLYERMK